jgi:predicted amidohydrolase
MSRTQKVGVVQLCARQQVDENLDKSERLVEQAHRQGAQLVVLPENFPYIGRLAHKVTLAEPLSEESPGPILGRVIALARRLEIHLLAGGIPIKSEREDRFYNTSVLLGPTGSILASYRKIHLFDINIPGGAVFTESDHVLPGDKVVTAEALGTIIGFSICYDLRFPELYRELARLGATIVTVPAAFTLHTGKDHWFPLLRARAIENQTFVLAAAQHGRHNEQRVSYGKACIVDPWGAVLAQAPDVDGVAVAELDLGYLERVRRELPCLGHRRL